MINQAEQPHFRGWIASGLLMTNALLWGAIAVPSPALAQERSAKDICLEAIIATQKRIVEGRTINLEMQVLDLDESRGYLGDRSQELQFIMGDFSRPGLTPDGRAVLQSPVLMQSMATEIISDCPSIGSVVFAAADSEWAISFGLIEGGVQAFQCLQREPWESSPAPWGFLDCNN
ncbi:MAG: hypothetical protein MUF49_10860 [Oculatellaceae cyanobacterium Prado106]|nr:hypothetical protein [Oculatellaceae cyanobacterium Prado106]